MITLYNVISADGFIADENGNEDFIPDEIWGDFLDLCLKHDVVVMGAKTYEAIQKYPIELLEKFERLTIKRVVISRDKVFSLRDGYILINSPEEVLKLGDKILLSSGPTLNSVFLNKGLIDLVILNILPAKVNKGIRVFHEDPVLDLVSEEYKGDRRKVCMYKITQ